MARSFNIQRHPLTLAICIASSMAVQAEETSSMAVQAEETSSGISDTIVVTTSQAEQPLLLITDPKAPRQPLPAADGADLLKNIPGFSVVRKGGSDGDPVLRGMAASRLGIILDGEQILGGCGMRMDPPTAYVFPEAYDQVTVLKGPQSVKYGPGTSAGVVHFERKDPTFDTAAISGDASLLYASADRNDQMAHILAGNPNAYLKLNATRADANNYEDGNGNEVHSAYTRWSTDATVGLTPNDNSRFELSAGRSDGEARYADRSMDGSKFDRKNIGGRWVQQLAGNDSNAISPRAIEARVYRNRIDHVMDNYSLRSNSGMTMVSNPDRDTKGALLSLTSDTNLSDLPAGELEVGLDWQSNSHRLRSATGMMGIAPDYESLTRQDDMRFTSTGLYAELSQPTGYFSSLHLGLRLNKDYARDLRSGFETSGEDDRNTLKNAFVRYEQVMRGNHRWYVGVGHSERAADYWERSKTPAATSMMMKGSASSFDLAPEATTQLDLGMLHTSGKARGSVSVFYAVHNNYILVEQLPDISSYASNARNISARSWGAEADASFKLAERWQGTSSAAWVHGQNLTDHQPLGQMPPLEVKFGLNYQTDDWEAGVLWRGVAAQNRVAVNSGTVVGQDIGQSPAFQVTSLHAAWKITPALRLSSGIDNLFDRAYAEHISRSGAAIAGYETDTRVNEPGRTLWLKGQYSF
ncbi:TonB-dependent copper receptor [Oceanobacter mangrovi]|uniref:TonB-dependent copper receptor n=1 Tax=Oceanobacter mangrovi TaxID=2862510 RepID=UPI001C8E6C0B|nr:TonB-dependent copper receptor [Oceanobacter mangrovi]